MNNLEVSNVETIFPGVATFRLKTIPERPEDWVEELPNLTQTCLGQTGMSFSPVIGARTSVRTIDSPTPPWSNDLFPHKDLMLTGSLIGNVVTGIACIEASGDVPGLQLVDTSVLLEELISRNIFRKHGINSKNLDQYLALFSFDSFFSVGLGRAAASPIDEGLDENDVANLLSKVKPAPPDGAYQDIIAVPLIETNPFSGNKGLCVDGGERFIGIQHSETGDVLPHELVNEIIASVKNTTNPKAKYVVKYEPGVGVLFVREGTIHNGLRGNNCRRVIHVGRIATNPKAHELRLQEIQIKNQSDVSI